MSQSSGLMQGRGGVIPGVAPDISVYALSRE